MTPLVQVGLTEGTQGWVERQDPELQAGGCHPILLFPCCVSLDCLELSSSRGTPLALVLLGPSSKKGGPQPRLRGALEKVSSDPPSHQLCSQEPGFLCLHQSLGLKVRDSRPLPSTLTPLLCPELGPACPTALASPLLPHTSQAGNSAGSQGEAAASRSAGMSSWAGGRWG